MSFYDDFITPVLRGGIPELVEKPDAPQEDQGSTTESNPEPTNRDKEPYLLNLSQTQAMTGLGILVAGIAAVVVVRSL